MTPFSNHFEKFGHSTERLPLNVYAPRVLLFIASANFPPIFLFEIAFFLSLPSLPFDSLAPVRIALRAV